MSALCIISALVEATDMAGLRAAMSAAAPATCGAAMLVPLANP